MSLLRAQNKRDVCTKTHQFHDFCVGMCDGDEGLEAALHTPSPNTTTGYAKLAEADQG